MKPHTCDEIPAERLIDYADGRLPGVEASKVGEHLAACEHCRDAVEALKESLDLAQIIWQDAEGTLGRIQSQPAEVAKPVWLYRPALIAAGIVLAFIVGMILRFAFRSKPIPVTEPPSTVVQSPPTKELTFAEIEHQIERSGLAAQMLAAADILAEHPEGLDIAKERYAYVIRKYPEAAARAKERLGAISERRANP